jgi:hypothetical protein
MSDLDEQIERMCADGKITPEDADQVRTFAEFLSDAGPYAERETPEGRKRFVAAWKKHYPEDYAQAAAEKEARDKYE